MSAGNSKGRENAIAVGDSAQRQGNNRELVWAQTGRVAGPPPEAHAGTGAAHGDRLGLSQPPVGWELGRAELTGNKFRKGLARREVTGV